MINCLFCRAFLTWFLRGRQSSMAWFPRIRQKISVQSSEAGVKLCIGNIMHIRGGRVKPLELRICLFEGGVHNVRYSRGAYMNLPLGLTDS